MKYYSIAIDGPAGSGKSTVAQKVANELNFEYINSGSFYRAISIYLDENRIDCDKEWLITKDVLDKIDLTWKKGVIFLNGDDVHLLCRRNEYGRMASIIAQYALVRDFVNRNILDISKVNNIVVDGRDIGSAVLPEATVKIFLEADITTRAIRRLKQESQNTVATLDINNVINEIIERDNRDYTRKIAPLVKVEDAICIDSSNLTVDETCDLVKRAFMRKVTNADWTD